VGDKNPKFDKLIVRKIIEIIVTFSG